MMKPPSGVFSRRQAIRALGLSVAMAVYLYDRRPAARLAHDCIRHVEVLEYPELGMEAIWKIDVVDFPAFIVVDDKGNDFFTDPAGTTTVPLSGIRVRSAE